MCMCLSRCFYIYFRLLSTSLNDCILFFICHFYNAYANKNKSVWKRYSTLLCDYILAICLCLFMCYAISYMYYADGKTNVICCSAKITFLITFWSESVSFSFRKFALFIFQFCWSHRTSMRKSLFHRFIFLECRWNWNQENTLYNLSAWIIDGVEILQLIMM